MENNDLRIKEDKSGIWCIRKSNVWISLNRGNFSPFLPLLEFTPNALNALILESESEIESTQNKFPLEKLLLCPSN